MSSNTGNVRKGFDPSNALILLVALYLDTSFINKICRSNWWSDADRNKESMPDLATTSSACSSYHLINVASERTSFADGAMPERT